MAVTSADTPRFSASGFHPRQAALRRPATGIAHLLGLDEIGYRRVLGADLDETERAVRLRFRNGTELAVPLEAIAEIAHAPLAKLRTVVASPLGDGLIFDDAGVAIYVPGLLRDLFGEAFAGALGKRGGKARTPAKVAAARKNGRKGGRPRKHAAV